MEEIDLNLLRVFDILYDECNVTRAAARLGLTQPAVSHALARLRKTLGDPLFVRAATGLRPTERAHRLIPRLRGALAEIRSMVDAPAFDPATSARHFTIWARSYFCALVIPTLLMLARKSAPGVSLQITATDANLAQALDHRRIDIVLGGIDKAPARFRTELLFRDEMTWIMNARHPLAKWPFNRDAFLAQPRLAIERPRAGDTSTGDDIHLRPILTADDSAAIGASIQRVRPQATVYDAATAVAVTAASDMVTMVPRRFAEAHSQSHDIQIVNFPHMQTEVVDLSMLWHSHAQEDAGSLWLRGLTREAVKQLVSPADDAAQESRIAATGVPS